MNTFSIAVIGDIRDFDISSRLTDPIYKIPEVHIIVSFPKTGTDQMLAFGFVP